ncbi:MAG TPA: penicillin-binding protein 2 [Anaerolineae bacterium]|nr:penicillin-binding protein 2 [Anaerolineae bacterium]
MIGHESHASKLRLTAYRLVLGLVFVVLVGQLWRLQIQQGDYYSQAAESNRIRLQADAAPRGVIYDRRGHLLARNQPQLTVSIVPAYLPEDPEARRQLLLRLSKLIEMPLRSSPAGPSYLGNVSPDMEPIPNAPPGILDILETAETDLAYYRPALLKEGISREVAMALQEEHLDWPGVLVQAQPVREYLHGSLTSHILGYVGPIPSEDVERYEAEGYDADLHSVGISGIEHSFERDLHGDDGQKLIEVDVHGREIGTVGEPEPAVPGYNLQLTLDLDLQQAAEEILKEQLQTLNKTQGVVIAMNPQTGEILALVSLPSYDNNEFSGGISSQALQKLQEDPSRPLVNHAISGMFPPGSTFKITVAAGALEEGVVTANSTFHCGGILWLPNRFYPGDPSLAQPFYCWVHTSYGRHGSLSIVSALGRSCDIYFYQAAGGYRDQSQGLGAERVAQYAQLFGFGARSGIDLAGEATGLIPDAKWKRVNYSESWVTGDTYNMAIGQGFVLATPLQVLNAAATIANGGTLYRPQLVRQVIDGDGQVVRAFAPDVIRQVPISPANMNLVREGMRAVVAGAGATAWAMKVPGVAVAGKTGTSEFFEDRNKDGLPDRDKEGHLPTHAWFTAFAPYENPEIALVVFIYGGGEGSAAAVPVASDILNYYFSRDIDEVVP